MASTKISALATTDTLSSLDGNDYLVVGNGTTNSNSKLLANSIITTLSSIGYSTPKYLISSISNSNVVIQKGLKSANSKLTVTDTTSGDDKNILLTVVETAIDLSNCINTTSPFLSTVNLASNVGATILPVANGGTGVATLTDKSVLITQDSGTDTVAAVAMSTNGQILMGGTSGPAVGTLTPGTNVTISNADGAITINAALAAALGSNLNMANYSIDLGTGWLSFDGNAAGIKLPVAGKVYVGDGTPISTSSLNVETGLTFVGGKAQTIEVAAAGSTGLFTLKGSSGNAGGVNAGGVTLAGGGATGSGAGGVLKLVGGDGASAGYAGQIQLLSSIAGTTTPALIVDGSANVIIDSGLLTIKSSTSGFAQTSKSTVTQLSNHSTAVTTTGGSGVITLKAVELNAGAQAEFTVTNAFVTATSMINLTVEGPGISAEPVNSLIIAQVASIGNGSYKIVLSNIGSANTDSGARKIHYLVVQ